MRRYVIVEKLNACIEQIQAVAEWRFKRLVSIVRVGHEDNHVDFVVLQRVLGHRDVVLVDGIKRAEVDGDIDLR